MLRVVIGAPCSGKSTYVQEHRQAGDVVIDYDLIAKALGFEGDHLATGNIRLCALAAREAAIKKAIDLGADAWVIHTAPTDAQAEEYELAGAEWIVMETDMETCLARCEQDGRPDGTAEIIRDYYRKDATPMLTKHAFTPLAEDGGTVKGYAATFDRDPDSYGDVIAPGAFANSLKRWESLGMPIPLLYGHKTDDPEYNIGAVTHIEEDERGLYVEAAFDAENPKAQYVRKLVREGRLFQFSFMFDCKDAATVTLENGMKANELLELDIFEVSLVQVPANQHAEVVEVKAGRRNSKKDEDALRRAKQLIEELDEVIDGLIEEPVSEQTEEPAEANADEPKANADEQSKANVTALIDEANTILMKGETK